MLDASQILEIIKPKEKVWQSQKQACDLVGVHKKTLQRNRGKPKTRRDTSKGKKGKLKKYIKWRY